jgi:DNA invertase Pin-like site-specific DNA recombinase
MPRDPEQGGEGQRCAIYTRKSSEEGLEQDFNSLDAQFEACLAYIASQKQEGWVAVAERFDDGGYSGGSTRRPALRALMEAVEAGRVDIIVVYKVDRLTRNLSDFARLVEVFDRKGVSFVSVTQQFNTTTSMGRLTLNVLLSFAQFEREVTAERIRDKIAASKKRGMWMGGSVPLGYDHLERKLVINAAEAETVRLIYRRYLELGSVRSLKQDLTRSGIVSKRRISQGGKVSGGKAFERGALYHILKSRIYLGAITHKGTTHPGQHEAIIDQDLYDAVQAKLAESNRGHKAGTRAQEPSLLKGKLFDAKGLPLTASHTSKGGRRYRYYVASEGSPLNRGPQPLRLPAAEIEGAVKSALLSFVSDPLAINDRLGLGLDSYACEAMRPGFEGLAETLSDTGWPQLVAAVKLEHSRLEVTLDQAALVAALGGCDALPSALFDQAKPRTLSISQPIKLDARSQEVLVIAPQGAPAARPIDPALLKAVARAHCWREMITSGKVTELEQIARHEGLYPRYLRRILNLAFLAPDIVEAVLRGDASPSLLQQELQQGIPLDWSTQRKAFDSRGNPA